MGLSMAAPVLHVEERGCASPFADAPGAVGGEGYSGFASPQPCQWSTRIQQLTLGRSRLA